jgi:hypothetical protein
VRMRPAPLKFKQDIIFASRSAYDGKLRVASASPPGGHEIVKSEDCPRAGWGPYNASNASSTKTMLSLKATIGHSCND